MENLLLFTAISFGVNKCRDSDNNSRDSIATCHHVEGFELGVKDQDYHPEELYALQTHPAKCRQVEEVQHPCYHCTANLMGEGNDY